MKALSARYVIPDLGPDYRVAVTPYVPTEHHALIVVDHMPSWRRKSGTAQIGRLVHMAACLKEDIESDLFDVAQGNMPPEAGRFVPEAERDELLPLKHKP
jgi:hypothetical protein